MAFSDILYSKKDGVARITINRPEVYNAIRGKTTDEMVVALEDAANDNDIRVVVIAGSGLTHSVPDAIRAKTVPARSTAAQRSRASQTSSEICPSL